jgi:uncharacterized membrane protein
MMPSEASLQAKRQELMAIAESKEFYLANEWLIAIQQVKDLMTLDALTVAVMNNDVYAIQRAFSPEAVQLRLKGFKDAMTNHYATSGVQIAKNITVSGVYFNQVNPRLVGIVNNWTNTLITNETQATIQGIGAELSKATLRGVNPLQSARAIRGSIGLTPQQVKAIQNYEAKLRAGESVTSYKLRDKRLTKKVLKEDDIIKRVDRYRQKQLKYRAETIARTEALRMTNMANQHIYENAIEEGSIGANDYRRYWVPRRDSKTRDAHLTLPSMNKEGRAINEPFISTLGRIMYPHDPTASAGNTINCRCVVIYALQASAFL